MRRTLVAIVFFALLIGVWEVLVRMKIWSPVLVPSPLSVVSYLDGAIRDGTLGHASLVTMRRLLIGYGLGLVFGLPLGLLTARFKFCEDTIGIIALGFQTLPSVCWVPLALLWFGQTEAAMLFVVVMGTLWSVVIATDNGCEVPVIERTGTSDSCESTASRIRAHSPALSQAIVTVTGSQPRDSELTVKIRSLVLPLSETEIRRIRKSNLNLN